MYHSNNTAVKLDKEQLQVLIHIYIQQSKV